MGCLVVRDVSARKTDAIVPWHQVTEGDGKFLVTAVGRQSEWGKILSELDTVREDTPLQVTAAYVYGQLGASHASTAAAI